MEASGCLEKWPRLLWASWPEGKKRGGMETDAMKERVGRRGERGTQLSFEKSRDPFLGGENKGAGKREKV